MKSELLKSMREGVKYWWVSLIIGLIALALGIWSLITPDKTLVALTYVFMIGFILSGVIEIFSAIMNRHVFNDWGWSLASGIIDILFGVLLLAIPRTIITTLLIYLVGLWILIRSVWMIGQAHELQKLGVSGWGWSLGFAILGILFSFFFLLSPMLFKGTFIVMFATLALLTYGIFRIYLAFRLRSVNKEIKKYEKGY